MSTPDLIPAEVNIPLLRKAVEWAEAEAAKPERESEWRQRFWVTPLAAEATQWGESNMLFTAESSNRCGTCFCIAGKVVFDEYGPTSDFVPDLARQLLGISDDQSERLFAPGNKIADVRRIAEDIAGERL